MTNYIKLFEPYFVQTSIPFPVIKHSKEDEQIKKAEIRLAVSVACHTAIKSVDHIAEIVKSEGTGSVWENTKLHRTKCGKIISKVSTHIVNFN